MAGVDGVPGGWVVARVALAGGTDDADAADTDGRRIDVPEPATAPHPTARSRATIGPRATAPVRAGEVRWCVLPSAADVLAATRDCAAVGIDIPLGLPAGPGRRTCDVLVAQRLGRARSSVFPAPPRAVLAAGTYDEACAAARQLTGRAISMQTFHIGAKIREWDDLTRPARVVEVHPELSLRSLAPDVAFAPKRTVRGAGQRIAALARWIHPSTALAALPAGARLDDVLDALVAAWSAARHARGVAELVGVERDDRGHPMGVVL